MRNTDMRISNNLLQEQPHARRTGDMWDIPFPSEDTWISTVF